jgi:hypothetical protein
MFSWLSPKKTSYEPIDDTPRYPAGYIPAGYTEITDIDNLHTGITYYFAYAGRVGANGKISEPTKMINNKYYFIEKKLHTFKNGSVKSDNINLVFRDELGELITLHITIDSDNNILINIVNGTESLIILTKNASGGRRKTSKRKHRLIKKRKQSRR